MDILTSLFATFRNLKKQNEKSRILPRAFCKTGAPVLATLLRFSQKILKCDNCPWKLFFFIISKTFCNTFLRDFGLHTEQFQARQYIWKKYQMFSWLWKSQFQNSLSLYNNITKMFSSQKSRMQGLLLGFLTAWLSKFNSSEKNWFRIHMPRFRNRKISSSEEVK